MYVRTIQNWRVYFSVFLVLLVLGCGRGFTSKRPPIHIISDMDYQPKYQAQEASGHKAGVHARGRNESGHGGSCGRTPSPGSLDVTGMVRILTPVASPQGPELLGRLVLRPVTLDGAPGERWIGCSRKWSPNM